MGRRLSKDLITLRKGRTWLLRDEVRLAALGPIFAFCSSMCEIGDTYVSIPFYLGLMSLWIKGMHE
jgi:hypothetical protein